MCDWVKFPENIDDQTDLKATYSNLRAFVMESVKTHKAELEMHKRQQEASETDHAEEIAKHRGHLEKLLLMLESAGRDKKEVEAKAVSLEAALAQEKAASKEKGFVIRDKDHRIKKLNERIAIQEGIVDDRKQLESDLDREKNAHAVTKSTVEKLEDRLKKTKSTIDGLRKNVKAGDLRLAAQHAAAVSGEQHERALGEKDARILELQRLLHDAYRAPPREVDAGEAAEFVSNLRKEVAHLQAMVRTSKERETLLLKDVEAKNERKEVLEAQIARYEEFLAGHALPAAVRRWLDPEVVVDTEKLMKRLRTERNF